jgi:hypothetical protein
MKPIDWYLPFGILCISVGALFFGSGLGRTIQEQGCKSPQAAVTGIFTAEQASCMTATVLAEDLTGDPQTIASDISAACQLLPSVTSGVIAFVQTFLATPTGQAMKAKRLKAPIVP